MKILAKNYVWTILLGLIFVLSTCDIVGLGNRVNTEKPVISIPEDPDGAFAPGAFFDGNSNVIHLDIQQEFGIREVYMEIEYRGLNEYDPADGSLKKRGDVFNGKAPDRPRVRIPAVFVEDTDPEKSGWRVYLGTEEIDPANIIASSQQDSDTELYYVTVNAFVAEDGERVGAGVPNGIEDGIIKAWVTAIDVSGNKTTSTEMLYNVKNRPPEIELSIPAINGYQFDRQDFIDSVPENNEIFTGSRLMGIATDLLGMEANYPQIMLWPADEHDNLDFDANTGLPIDTGSGWFKWHSVVDKDGMPTEAGTTAVQFRWPLVYTEDIGEEIKKGDDLPVGRYHFVMRTKDTKGTENFYPNRKGSTLTDSSSQPKYIPILIQDLNGPKVTLPDMDSHYDGTKDFVVEDVFIQSSNPIAEIKITLSKSASIQFVSIDAGLYLDPPYSSNVDDYTIRIPAADVKKLLDSNGKDDVSAHLHIEATDDVNIRTTTSRAFVLKNELPQIELFSPAVSGALFDDQAYLDGLVNTDIIFVGNSLMGMAEDTFGLKSGYPQIMLWPADELDNITFDEDGFPVAGTDWWNTWHTLKDRNGADLEATSRTAQFRWPLKDAEGEDLPAGRYQFVIRTKNSVNTLSSFDGDQENYYPNRADSGAANKANQPKFIEIWVQDLDGPSISPFVIDNFYDGKKDFVVEDVEIRSSNPVVSIKIGLSRSSEANFALIDAGKYLSPAFGTIIDPDDPKKDKYTITIPNADIKTQLGINNNNRLIDVNAYLHIQVLDDVDKPATTSKSFTLKNQYPQVELITPSISGNGFDTYSANTSTDPDNPDDGIFYIGNTAPIFVGGTLMGSAEDTLGVVGAETQIMLWPANQTVTFDDDGLPVAVGTDWWNKWYTLKDRSGFDLDTEAEGSRSVQFRWPLKYPEGIDLNQDLPPGRYRFVIRTKDLYENVNYYPKRSDYSNATTPATQPQFIEIWVQAVTAPTITIPADFPAYFDGKKDFEAFDIGLQSPNPIVEKKVILRTSSTTPNWGNNDDDDYFSPGQGPHKYVITIPKSEFETMLSPYNNKVDVDAYLHIWVKDDTGNEVSVNRSFVMKNQYPQVELITPAVSGDQFDNQTYLTDISTLNSNAIFVGGTLVGSAEDTYGIRGSETQIMLWSSDVAGSIQWKNGLPTGGAGVTWQTLKDRNGNPLSGESRSVQFRWPLKNAAGTADLPVGKYQFVIRTVDLFGNVNYYPNRSDSTLTTGTQPKWIEIWIQALDVPTIEIPTLDSFYAGDKDFVIEDVVIESPNPVIHSQGIKIGLSKSATANFASIDAGKYLSPDFGTITDPADPKKDKYKITIPNADIRTMLGIDSTSSLIDVEAHLHIQVTDNIGKSTPATKSFVLKNQYPQIELFTPPISDNQFDNQNHIDNLINTDVIFVGNSLMGMAEDSFGLKSGYPQIMLWPAEEYITFDEDGYPVAGTDWWNTWHTLKDRNGADLNLTSRTAQFRWPLKNPDTEADLPAGKYRFVIKTMNSVSSLSSFDGDQVNYYPNRADSGATDKTAQPKFIEIWVQNLDVPSISPFVIDNFYDGTEDFVVEDVEIRSSNPVVSLKIGLSRSATANFALIDAGKYLNPAFGEATDDKYTITIPNADIKTQLGINNTNRLIDVNAYLHIQVLDDVEKEATTSKSFTLKNQYPQVELITPSISGNGFDTSFVANSANAIFVGGTLMGSAEDTLGVVGAETQIMLWPANQTVTFDDDGLPVAAGTEWWNKWYTLKDRSGDNLDTGAEGSRSVQFRWPLKYPEGIDLNQDLPPGRYRFVIRTKDLYEKVNYYPKRSDYSNTTTPAAQPKYIEIWVQAVTAPTITIPANFPAYFDGKKDFEAVDIGLQSPNPIVEKKVVLTTSSTTPDWDKIDGDDYFSAGTDPHKYQIIIPSTKFETMLKETDKPYNSKEDVDAYLHIWVKDDTGKEVSVNRAFVMKNQYPQVELITPAISGAEFDVPAEVFSIFVGGTLMGSAEDTYGIVGSETQIMLWPVDKHSEVIIGTNDFPTENTISEWSTWYTLKDRNGVNLNTGTSGSRSVQFRWPLTNAAGADLPVGNYRFVIRTKDLFGNVNYYPKRSDYDSTKTTLANQPKWLEIWIQAPNVPVIEIPTLNSFYKGDEQLVIEDVVIKSPNPVIHATGIKIGLSRSSEVNFATIDAGKYLSPLFGTATDDKYTITIPNADIRTMLNITDANRLTDVDAHLHIQVTDNIGNSTPATKSFVLKNQYPQIELFTPSISGQNFDDQSYLSNIANQNSNAIFVGGNLMGAAEDSYGIVGSDTEIMLWPADEAVGADGLPAAGSNWWNSWYKLRDREGNNLDTGAAGSRSVQFRWPLRYPGGPDLNTDLPPGKYRFVMRTKDLFGNVNYYPNRSDSTLTTPATQPQFIEIWIQAVTAPTITIPSNLPSYFDGKGEFKAEDVVIVSPNPVVSVKVTLSTNAALAESAFDGITAGQYITKPGQNYTVTIPNDAVKTLLSSGKDDVDAYLHIEVKDNTGTRATASRAFVLKNEYPQVELITPSISSNQFDEQDYLDGIAVNAPIFMGNSLMGSAEDNYGIRGANTQIMLWPLEQHNNLTFNSEGLPVESTSSHWFTWYTLQDRNGNPLNGESRSMQFRWPLKNPDTKADLPVGKYRFVIRTEDRFDNVNYYPNRYESNLASADQPKWIEIWIQNLDGPSIQMENPDAYFDGRSSDDFSFPVTIRSSNPIETIGIVLSTITTGITFDDGFSKYLEPAYTSDNTSYTIKIPNADIKSMLGIDTNSLTDVDAHLHIHVEDTVSLTASTSKSFIVKNQYPTIELFTPSISGNQFDTQSYLNDIANSNSNAIFVGGNLMGAAEDSYGIVGAKTQIMLWPENQTVNFDSNGLPVAGTEWWNSWYTLKDRSDNALSGESRTAQFRWPLKHPTTTTDLPPGKYRFVIRTEDRFENVNYYPNRSDSSLTSGTQPQYIEIWIQAVTAPTINIPSNLPSYFDGKGEFKAEDVVIVSPNPVVSVKVTLSRNAVFTETDFNNASIVNMQYLTKVGENYTISIPNADVKTLLASEKADVNAYLHIEVKDDTGTRVTASRAFVLKNEYPQIELITPSISGDQFDTQSYLTNIANNAPIFMGNSLMGSAEDNYGIVGEKTQIMLWPLGSAPTFANGLPVENKGSHWNTWYTLKDRNGVNLSGESRSVQFRWPLKYAGGADINKDLPVGRYQFVIKTEDRFGNVNYYPNRTDSTLTSGTQPTVIDIWIQNLNGPSIQMLDDPDSYFDGRATTFSISNVEILSSNPVERVRIGLSKDASVTFATINGSEYLSPAIGSSTDNKYTISIPNADIRTMLDINAANSLIDVDAHLHIQVEDNVGLTASTSRSFVVKNQYPQMELFSPSISGVQFDSQGGLTDLADDQPLFVGGTLMGMVEDSYGIVAAETQIMLWPVDQHTSLTFANDLPVADDADDGNKWFTWRTLKDRTGTDLSGDSRTVQFRWPLTDPVTGDNLPVGRYRFAIRTKDLLGNVNNYPNRSETTGLSDQARYIEIWIQDVTGPTITIPSNLQSYFDGNTDFVTDSIITIRSPNPLTSLKLTLNKDSSFVFVGTPSVDLDKYLVPEYSAAITEYAVSIPREKVIELLESGTEDIPAFLHIHAVDNVGNTGSASRSFILKNTPPQIQLFMPVISGTSFALGQAELTAHLANSPVYVGVDIMGLATDSHGIEKGYPQILFWPANATGLDTNGFPEVVNEADWEPLTFSTNTDGTPSKSFSYPMEDYLAGQYRFVIRTMDSFGNFHYYPTLTPSFSRDKYMQINYMSTESPRVTITQMPTTYTGVLGEFAVKFQVAYSTFANIAPYVYLSDQAGGAGITSERIYIDTDDSSLYTEAPDKTYREYTLTITEEDKNKWALLDDGKGLDNKEVFLFVVAEDTIQSIDGRTSRPFMYSTAPPEVTISAPSTLTNNYATGLLEGGQYSILYPPTGQRPRWVTGEIEIRGSNSMPTANNAIPLHKMYFHVGKLDDDVAALTDTDRHAIYNTASWTEVVFGEAGWDGVINSWRYSSNFNDYRATHSSLIQEDTELGADFNGEHHNTDGYQEAGLADNLRRFYLPFYVKVEDSAGNFRVVHYKLSIDPNMDIPVVSFISPNQAETVGGEVTIMGSAEDDNWIHSVQLRITNKDGKLYIPSGAKRPLYKNGVYDEKEGDGSVSYPTDAATGVNGDLASDYPDGGWFNATIIGSGGPVVTWRYVINEDAGLTPTGDSLDDVKIEARAIDTKDLIDYTITDETKVGFEEVLNLKFSDAVPTITQIKIVKAGIPERDYFEGIGVSGEFKITTEISSKERIRHIRFRLAGAAWVNPIDNLETATTGTTPTGTYTIEVPKLEGSSGNERWITNLEITVDSLYYYEYGRTGYLPVEIYVEDNTAPPPFTARSNLNISIDNFFPRATVLSPANASGEAVLLAGDARDYSSSSGPIQGLERVMVFFERGRIVYSGVDGTTRTVTGYATPEYLNPRGWPIPNSGSTAGDPFYNKAPYTSDDNNQENWHSATIGMPSLGRYDSIIDTTWPGYSEDTNRPNRTDPLQQFDKFPMLREVTKTIGGQSVKIWESPHAMIIDRNEMGVDTDTDIDGTSGEVWDGLVDISWGARMNTILKDTAENDMFPDGPYIVHYIVMDKAGNATYYNKDIYIENNKPMIVDINLGTKLDPAPTANDIFLDRAIPVGATTSGNTMVTTTPSFRVRNRKFSLKLNTEGGNGDKIVNVTHVTRNADTIEARLMVRGGVYTIATGGTTDWEKYGAPHNTVDTTFVASGPGEGSGMVYQYTTVADTSDINRTIGEGDQNTVISFSDGDFGTVTGTITDSAKTPAGDPSTPDDKLFIVKVYDTTVTSTPPATAPAGADQLAHVALVGVNIDNNDGKAPTIQVVPFGKEIGLIAPSLTVPMPTLANDAHKTAVDVSNYNNNIVTTTAGVRQGYVQYAEHTLSETGVIPGTPGVADISGKVIFLGRAADNQIINQITATILGYNGDAAFPIANRSGGTMVSANTVTDVVVDGDNIIRPATVADVLNGDADWAFELVGDEFLTLEYGHSINWRFAWDSGSRTNGNDIQIQFNATDALTPTPNNANVSPNRSINVDIVPYITGVEGQVYNEARAFARSARGWYPVRELETITIRGFNLSGTTAISNTGGTNAITLGTVTRTTVGATITGNAVSGALSLTANGIVSINNNTNITTTTTGGVTTRNVPYNFESTATHETLTNRRNLYVWDTGYLINSTNVANPYMRMYQGNRYIAFGTYVDGGAESGQLKLILNNSGLANTGAPNTAGTAAERTVATQQNRYQNIGLALSSAGRWILAASNMTAAGQSNFSLFHNTWGTGNSNANGGIGQAQNNAGQARRRVRDLGSDPNRIRIPRVAIDGNNILVGYYDNANANRPITVHYGTRDDGIWGGNIFTTTNYNTTNPQRTYTYANHGLINDMVVSVTGGGGTNVLRRVYGVNVGNGTFQLRAGDNGTNWNSTAENVTINSGGIPNANAGDPSNANRHRLASGTGVGSDPRGSEYLAVGISGTDDARAVVAWYDEVNSRLYYATNTLTSINSTATGTTDWTIRQIGTDVGLHVDMIVTAAGVHLAYVHAQNDNLYYTFIPDANIDDPTATGSNMRTVKVDTTASKLMLSVRNDIPYISYLGTGNNRNTYRVAWLRGAASTLANVLDGIDENNMFTGNWEVMAIPGENRPSEVPQFVSNGVPDNATGWAAPSAVGTGDGAIQSTLNYTANINQTIVVGYMTNRWYEGAVIKGNISQAGANMLDP